MAIKFYQQDCKFTLPRKRITKKWITQIIESNNFQLGTINYIFCSENEILTINSQFLNHNFFTDIITFPYTEGKVVSADIFISIDTVKTNAKKYNQIFLDELNRVIIHGVLHLVGFNDKSKAEKSLMRSEEDKSLLLLKYLLENDVTKI